MSPLFIHDLKMTNSRFLSDQQAEWICGGGDTASSSSSATAAASIAQAIALQVNRNVRQKAIANGSFSNNFTNNFESFNGSNNLFNIGG